MIKCSNARRARFFASLFVLVLTAVMVFVYSGCGSAPKYKITGTVTFAGAAFPGVTVTLSGDSSAAATTDASGNYSFNDLQSGTYTVTPSLMGYTFSPPYRPAFLKGSDAIGWNFSGSCTTMVAASLHTYYLKSDGTLWAWGNNGNGQFGNGTAAAPFNSAPVQISGLSGVIAIVAGGNHTVYLKTDGTVWAAGLNTNGQLGDGTTAQRITPVRVSGLSNVTAVIAGDAYTVALKSDGTVWSWGKNLNGQLGKGTSGVGTDSSVPVQATGLTGITSIDAGDDFTVALKSDSTVWAWGNNGKGQLGDGTTTQRDSPVQVQASLGVALSGMSTIIAGGSFTIAMKNDGTFWAWGNNTDGQFCNGVTVATNSYPVAIGIESLGITGISTGSDHTAFIKSDATVWTCGNNSDGQLGNSDITGTSQSIPQATGLTSVTVVSAGNQDTVAVKSDGTLWAWGNNANGQLGDKTTIDKSSPVQVQF